MDKMLGFIEGDNFFVSLRLWELIENNIDKSVFDAQAYAGMVVGLGVNVFLYDVEACIIITKSKKEFKHVC